MVDEPLKSVLVVEGIDEYVKCVVEEISDWHKQSIAPGHVVVANRVGQKFWLGDEDIWGN